MNNAMKHNNANQSGAAEDTQSAQGAVITNPRSKAVECLECGRRLGSLARHLSAAHGMSVEQYRAKHGADARIVPEGFRQTSQLEDQVADDAKEAPEVPQQKVENESVTVKVSKAAVSSFAAAEKARDSLIGKSKKLNELRYEIAGHLAQFIAEMEGDEGRIRAYVEPRDVIWPAAQCKRPMQQALVLFGLFPDEDAVNMKSRISEWSKVLVVLTVNKVFGKAAVEFITKHGGVKGVYAHFRNDGKPNKDGAATGGNSGSGMTDDEADELLDNAKPLGKARLARTFSTVVGQYAVALVRVDAKHPETVEVIDSLELSEATVRKAMTKLAKTLKAVTTAADDEE